jgi:hypothetical protein
MKTVNRLAAAIAVALSMGIATQANAAPIELRHNGIGDAMLFPVFNGYVENYFTITNSSGNWEQGHIRFRGASWSAELLDFDVILSPGDVFVFRLADLDGDGLWEIDMSIDPNNFRYTSVQATGCNGTCIDASNALEPSAGVVSDGILRHQRNVGYVEFIGECQLDGMTPARMNALLTAGSSLAPLGLSEANRTKVGNGLGTNCWVWGDAPNSWVSDRGLTDFPNVAAGTAFISIPGQSHGVAYNSETFVNFRTGAHFHRVDNYRIVNGVSLDAANAAKMDANDAVIVHEEDSNSVVNGPSPFGDYVYRFLEEGSGGRNDESRISFNNTWGPTLADGDDYGLFANFYTNAGVNSADVAAGTTVTLNAEFRQGQLYFIPNLLTPEIDFWDNRLATSRVNSIAEVESAIRKGGQAYDSFYFDGASLGKTTATLKSWFFAHFPTKFYYGEDPLYYGKNTFRAYLDEAVRRLMQMG